MSAVTSLGGELELPLETLFLAGESASPPEGFVAVDSGRNALRLIARALRERGADGPVLLPEYLCASVLQPFRSEGFAVEYYTVGADLCVDPAELERRTSEVAPAALLVIDYFGFPFGTDAVRAASLPGELTVIEDVSHSSVQRLRAPDRPDHYVVASLRKTLLLPDGAFCAGSGLAAPGPGDGRAAGLRALAKALRHELLTGLYDSSVERAALELLAQAEQVLDAGTEPESMSMLSARLLSRVDLDAVERRRRANYTELASELAATPAAAVAVPLLGAPPDGVAPLAFPVRVTRDRERLRAALAKRRVFCPVHWPLPDGGAHASAAARKLSADIISLPIDHRYGEDQMRELVQRLVEAAEDEH